MGLWFPLCTLLLCLVNESVGGNCPELYKRYSNRHTFCLPANASCSIQSNKVSSADIATILNAHNSYRSRVATGKETVKPLPKASNMMQLTWDNELAAVAQKHADQCLFDHDCNECRAVQNFGVGQNLYTAGPSSSPMQPDWNKAVRLWYEEVKDFDMGQLRRFVDGEGPPMTGHFTQVIWGNTFRVGCGYNLYKDRGMYHQLLTCNYGPGGNIQGSPLYDEGNPCSKCPINSCCDSSCASKRIPVDFPGLCKLTDNNGPQYPPQTGLIFSCNFNGEPDCASTVTSGPNKWKVQKTLSGSYISIVLNGGESSTLEFTTPFSAKNKMCFRSSYRKGPNVAGTGAANEAVEIFAIIGNQAFPKVLKGDKPVFTRFSMGMGWSMASKFSVKFSVPPGKPAQYLDLKDLAVTEGSC